MLVGDHRHLLKTLQSENLCGNRSLIDRIGPGAQRRYRKKNRQDTQTKEEALLPAVTSTYFHRTPRPPVAGGVILVPVRFVPPVGHGVRSRE
jgi:hypothetical protein